MLRWGITMAKLSPRQRELIVHLINGKILKEAGYAMGLAEGTAKEYLRHARVKLHARTTWELMYILGKEVR